MKKKNLFILILTIVVLVVGCKPTLGSEDIGVDGSETEELTISGYFPFIGNSIFDYEGRGNEFAEQKVHFEFIEDNKAQIKIMNPATSVVKVFENKDGELREIYSEGEFYHIENMLDFKEEKFEILLKEPLELGNSWTTVDGAKRSITGLDVDMEVPMGSFKALEVTTEFEGGRTQNEYYVKDIGMVASVYKDGDYVVETLLKSRVNGPFVIDLEAYYPLYSDIETVYYNDSIDFYTNDDIDKLLENILKTPPNDDLIAVIPDTVVINSVKLDRSSWTLRVDFSQELLTDLNVGSSMEAEILKSIVNTLGRMYDVKSVYISVEGQPYESGHYAIMDHEYFTVDIEGVEEYK